MAKMSPEILRYNFWESDRLNGSQIANHYLELEKFDNLNYSDAVSIQRRKLRDLLEYAVVNCPFYSKYDPNNLQSFPITDKIVLIGERDKIEVPVTKIPNQKGDVHIQKTSGSTGTPFSVPQDTEKRNRRIAELKYFGHKIGFETHEPLIHLRIWNNWQQKSKEQINKENIIPFDISNLDDTHIKEFVDLISDVHPVSLRGYASSLHLIADYYKRHELAPIDSLKVSVAGSEMLLDESRELIKKYLGGDVISQYADEECGILAQEKVPTMALDNPMYMNNASYVFELLKFDSNEAAEIGELGRIVLTDLYNKAFPIIRYDTGDTAVFGAPDAYSSGFPTIRHLYGRKLDLIYSSTGSPVHPMTFARTLKHYENIAQWQFIQNDKEDYELRLIMRDISRSDNMINNILCELSKILKVPTSNILVEFVDEIPVLKSGKRKSVMNKWQR